MDVFMFMVFLICNLFTVMICWFAYGSRDRYTQGMLMGVHIPADEVSNEEVQKICQKNRVWWKRLQIFGLLSGIAVCPLVFIRTEVFLLLWMCWFIVYLGGLYYLLYTPHRQMYRLKIQNGWIMEETRHQIHIDTDTAAKSEKMTIDWKWQLPASVVTLVLGLRVLRSDTMWEQRAVAWIFYAAVAAAVLVFLFLHMWITQKSNVVYSEDSAVNYAANRVVKHTWSEALLFGGWLSDLSLCWLVLQFDRYHMPDMTDYIVYAVLQAAALLFFLIPILSLNRKKQEILASDLRPVYVDDDEYWKDGWYNNPNDRRLMVQDRLSGGNFSFNMARPAAKVINVLTAALLIGVMVWFFMLMISMLNMHVDFVVDGAQVHVESVGYKCDFEIGEIESVELLYEFPDENFSKINGVATDQMNVGHFSSRVSGKTMMFLYAGEYPIIKVTLEDQVILINSDSAEEVEVWYKELKK